ncbi:unnamed protein product [Agarophyton chilense]
MRFSRRCLALLLLLPCVFVFALPVPPSEPHLPVTDMPSLMSFVPESLRVSLADDAGFASGFFQSLLLILACELGDRTFFVAAILAMKSSRLTIWAGALSALAAMTVLSAAIGKAFPLLLDKRYTSLAAAALFLYFGLQLLRDWWRMRRHTNAENDELAEVEEELATPDKKPKPSRLPGLPPAFMKALTMTALAEWGDRSQIATIALAASRDIYGVILGGVLGHAICTGLAVVGGRLLASKISEKAVALMGGLLFVCFAMITAGGYVE